MKLVELKNKEKAVILKVKGHREFKKRMAELGFVEGRIIEVVRQAPLQDPIDYRIMNFEVSLRRSEAELIEVSKDLDSYKESDEGITQIYNIENNTTSKPKIHKHKEINVALVGNPNCGKTTLFNHFTGLVEHVGNYSGVTVDAKKGSTTFKGYKINFIDLPGTYSLTAYSPEEKFVLDHLITEMPDIILNVADAGNLERNLYLTAQLLETNLKIVVALNMYDELQKTGAHLDYNLLGGMLGVKFVPTIASKKIGIGEVLQAIIDTYENNNQRNIVIRYQKPIERFVSDLTEELDAEKTHSSISNAVSPRFLAVKLLEQDPLIMQKAKVFRNYKQLRKKAYNYRQKIKEHLGSEKEIDDLIVNSRYAFVRGALKETFSEGEKQSHIGTTKLDNLLTHKFLGFPMFLLFLFLMFEGTFWLGKYPMEWIDYFIVWLKDVTNMLLPAGMLRDLLVDGVIGGVGSVIVFLPNILILFFFISFMEDTGYMARAAFIMDKLMHKIGLHGKSFIPLIMGFGCNVPAIMATRTIESKNDRLLTILINPFMSCSARLPVYILIAGTFFPHKAGLVIFFLYLLGITVAILVALIFKKIFFNKKEIPFVMELPPYRMPTMKSTLRHMWHKALQYLNKMGGIILVASVIIWFLGYFPRSKENEPKNAKTILYNSYIGQIGRAVQPAFDPLGFDWRETVAVIAGVSGKEVIVSTMGVLYAGDGDSKNDLKQALKTAKKSDGTPVFNKISALAFLVFVLLYFPCIATIATVYKETGTWTWPVFMMFYTTTLAWIFGFLVYKIGGLLL
jgi:ferrous iron transport protein B